MPRVHSLAKWQMLGRSKSYPWNFRKGFGYDVLVPVTFRLRFHTLGDGLTDIFDVGLHHASSPAGYQWLGSFPSLTSGVVTPGWAYGTDWIYHGYPVGAWDAWIVPWGTGYADPSMATYPIPPTVPVSPTDVGYYLMGIRQVGGAAPLRVSYYTANRLLNGAPPGGLSNWLLRQWDDGGVGQLILDSVEVIQTRKPSDPPEPNA